MWPSKENKPTKSIYPRFSCDVSVFYNLKFIVHEEEKTFNNYELFKEVFIAGVYCLFKRFCNKRLVMFAMEDIVHYQIKYL